MQQTFLILHITGALGILGVIISALNAIRTRRQERLGLFARLIGWSGAFQLLTGSFLALQSHGTILEFCNKIGLYLGSIIAVELLLAWQMKKLNLSFPHSSVIRPLTLGTIIAVITLVSIV